MKLPSKFKIDQKTECWNYTGVLNSKGYAPYKFYYKRHKGVELTKWRDTTSKMSLDHLCRNRKCVNPSHLELISHAENLHRGLRSRLNWDIIAKIRELYREGSKQPTIGRMFGIGQDHVSRIVNNHIWITN